MVLNNYARLGRLIIYLYLVIGSFQYTNGQNRALSNSASSAEAKALYCYMQSIYGKKILSGQMYSGWGFDEIAYIQTTTGKQPAIMGLDFIQESVNNTQVTLATNWWKKGGIPTMMWHWGAPSKGEGYPSSQLAIDINRCFTPGTAEYTAFWAELTKKADHLQQLRDANIPILWRPFHELNGGWFWWSKGNGTNNETAANKAALFRKLWITMYDYFVNTRKLNNLIWVLCYTGSPDGAWFPGNQYVDIAGGDEYASTNDPQLALYNKVKSSIGGNVMPVTLHECGIPPDPAKSLSTGAMFSWWMIWHTSYVQNMDKVYLKSTFNHDVILTLDELPNIMTACGGTTNPSPSVTLTTPINNSGVCEGTSITISGTASISSGNISKMDFYDGNLLLSTDNSSPYTYTWTKPSVGIHAIRIIATSAANIASPAATVNVTVSAPPVLEPYVQLNGAVWTAQAAIALCAGGNVDIGPHPVVATGWTWVGPNNFTSSAREVNFANVTVKQSGNYIATYKDANGCSSILEIPVTVNESPVVTITAPANNATIVSSPILITANVVGNGISNVQFYNGNTLLGSDATSPYSYSWTNTVNGSYTLSVKAMNTNNCSDTATVKSAISLITALDGHDFTSEVTCFPNPFTTFFIIQAPHDFEYVVYDVNGREVEKAKGKQQLTAGANLPFGIYVVKITSETKTQLLKISKQ